MMLITKPFLVHIDFHNTDKNTMEVNGCRQLSGYQRSPKYLLSSTEEGKSYRLGASGVHLFVMNCSFKRVISV